MKKILYLIMISVLLFSFTIPSSVSANDSSDYIYQDESGNQTSVISLDNQFTIATKKLNPYYYNMPDPNYNIVPESEMTHILLTKTWLGKNDMNPDPYAVQITFPKSWINETSQIYKEESTVELHVPKTLLMLDNESEKPDEITVSFPNDYFIGLPVKPLPTKPEIPVEKSYTLESYPDYNDYVKYYHNGDDIIGAKGKVVPYSYYNPLGESFCAYHEIEFRGDTLNDVVEIISQFDTFYGNRVWFAVYVNSLNTYVCAASISTSPGDTVNYEFRYSGTSVYCYLQKGSTWSQGYETDTTPPDDIFCFKGSSELDARGGISKIFMVDTYPLTVEQVYTSAWQSSSYVNQKLYFGTSHTSDDYVGINHWKNSSGLFFDEWACYFP